uniref:DUF11 domain-containing protein n=1 Tax=uncultured Chloroflexus sp. TaxID=214040 RepID=UPI0026249776
ATAVGPTGTATAVGPTNTATAVGPTGTATAVGPTGTATAVGPTGTATAVGPTNTATAVGPTGTATAVGPTGTVTPVGPTGTVTPVVPTSTPIATATPTPQLPPNAPGIIPDLVLTKSVAPEVAQVGDQVVYTLTLTNAGGAPALNVTIADQLPSFLQLIDTQASSGVVQINGSAVSVSLPLLNVGETVTVTIQAEVVALPLPPNNTNVAIARSTDTEITTDNNTSSSILQPTLPDLVLAKSVDPAVAQVGDRVVYTLVISNTGYAPASDVVLIDDLPAFLTVAGATTTAGEVEITGNQVTARAAALAPGEMIVVQVAAVVTAEPNGANTATVRSSNTEITTDNNTGRSELRAVLPTVSPETAGDSARPSIMPQTAGDSARPLFVLIGLAIIAIGLGGLLYRRSHR